MNPSPRVFIAVLIGVVSVGVFGYVSLSRRHAELARELGREQGLEWCYRTLTGIYENHRRMPANVSFQVVSRYEIDGAKYRVILGTVQNPHTDTLYRILMRQTDEGGWSFGMIHTTSNGSSGLTRFRNVTCPGLEPDEYAMLFAFGGYGGEPKSGYGIVGSGSGVSNGRKITWSMAIESPEESGGLTPSE